MYPRETAVVFLIVMKNFFKKNNNKKKTGRHSGIYELIWFNLTIMVDTTKLNFYVCVCG